MFQLGGGGGALQPEGSVQSGDGQRGGSGDNKPIVSSLVAGHNVRALSGEWEEGRGCWGGSVIELDNINTQPWDQNSFGTDE